jgi:outer membrane lipoprotein-sorting protein
MKPLQKEMKQLFQGIHVFLDKADGTIIKLDLKEFSGDNTLITFTEKQLNASIPDSEFVVK